MLKITELIEAPYVYSCLISISNIKTAVIWPKKMPINNSLIFDIYKYK